MSLPVSITGLGLVTPLGQCARETWDSLISDKFILDHATVRAQNHPDLPAIFGLARQAAAEAISDANWTPNEVHDHRTALVVGTSKGPVELWICPVPQRPITPCFGLSAVADDLSRFFKLGYGPRLTASAACASGLHALIRAHLLISSGQCTRALVVAAEASVHPLFIASFQRLGVLPPAGVGCKPFDEMRAGFLMSDSAAAVCLEADNSSRRTYARIAHVGLAGDATHLTGTDTAGATLRRLLQDASSLGSIDLAHAHATGTEVNDPVELAAINECLPGSTVYSHKAALGHSLGAAGLISIALNCIAADRRTIPGNVRTTRPLKADSIQLYQRPVEQQIRRSIALASGFGGACAAVALEHQTRTN